MKYVTWLQNSQSNNSWYMRFPSRLSFSSLSFGIVWVFSFSLLTVDVAADVTHFFWNGPKSITQKEPQTECTWNVSVVYTLCAAAPLTWQLRTHGSNKLLKEKRNLTYFSKFINFIENNCLIDFKMCFFIIGPCLKVHKCKNFKI